MAESKPILVSSLCIGRFIYDVKLVRPIVDNLFTGFRFEGAAPLRPSTNNGAEGTNRSIKSEWTDYKAEKMAIFLPRMAEMVASWSRRAEEIGVAVVPKIKDEVWQAAVKLTTSTGAQIIPLGTSLLRLVKGDPSGAIPPQDFANWFHSPQTSTSYDQHHAIMDSWHLVKPTPLGYLSCSCVEGLKKYRCQHSVFVEIKDGLVQVPDHLVRDPSFPSARKRGRPKKEDGGFGTRGK